MASSRSLGTLTVDVVAKIGGFTKGMTEAERRADKAGKVIQQRMERMGRAIDAGLQVAAAAAVAAFGTIVLGVNNAIDRLDEIGKSAQKVGIATEQLSKLAYAASLADVEFSALEGSLAKLAKAQDAAAQGTAAQLDLFRALGVAFQNADGTLRNTGDVFNDLADAFQRLPDGANKTTAAMTLLGRSGAQLIPLLNDGAEGIRAAGDELERFGGVVTPEAARQAEEFNDNITRLKNAADGLWASLARDLLPDLVRLTEKLLAASKEGGELRQVMDGVSTLVRGFGLAAQLAIDSVQGLTAATIGLFNAMNGLSKLNVTALWRGGPGADFEAARVAMGMAGESFAETRNNLWGGSGAPAGVSPFSGSRPGRAAATRDSAAEAIRAEEFARSVANSSGETERNAAAKAAAADAARALAAAEREAQRAIEEAARATADFREQTEDMAAELAGPVAQVQLEYARREADLVATANLAKLSQEELAASLALLTQARERDLKAAQLQMDIEAARLSPYEQLLADMDMELDLMGQTNAQREASIELERILQDARERGIEISAEEQAAMRQTIEARAEGLEATRNQISAMDDFRSSFADNVASVLDGSKSMKDAFRDLVSDLLAQMAKLAAQKFTEQLFGAMGTSQGGSAGGSLASLFGSFFGGGKAMGGPIQSGVPYLVGEQGPELIVPKAAGTVIPAGRTAAMMSGGVVNNIKFVLPGRNDLRSEAQRQADLARATSRQLSRATA